MWHVHLPGPSVMQAPPLLSWQYSAPEVIVQNVDELGGGGGSDSGGGGGNGGGGDRGGGGGGGMGVQQALHGSELKTPQPVDET